MSKHLRTEDQPSRWRRRILGVPVFAWLIAIPAGALGVVLAYYTLLLPFSGTLTSEDGLAISFGEGGTATATIGTPVCAVVDPAGGDELSLSMTGAMPGDQCSYTVGIYNHNDQIAYLQDLLAGSDAFTSGDYAMELGVGECGKDLPAWNGGNRSIGTNGAEVIAFTITASSNLTPGTTRNLDISLDGFNWVDAATYDPAGGCHLP